MEKQAKKQVTLYADYRRVFGTEQGQRVMHDIMKCGHMLESSFVKGDPNETLFREGERNMALRIMAILKVDPIKLEEIIRKREEDNARYDY